ncbi:sporulation integral membrane protein YlbJ [Shimazuella alba]|uniref:Sporulation integral membrane protein YlbJ n=1 Tax=Shimazuella alba TaxID=2690964 RepID=A0A6I4VTT8_9BACL|nr:sporulation integral membrane protein YlbJ [Shimazuella alba]MXQ53246.1 sporulation integral membrane protein YlbJ [Shimazuella alba]
MELITHRLQSQLKTVFLAMFALLFAVTLVLYPEIAFKASLRGLKIWWDVVFPAMLPFFITAELMMGFGVVHLLGVLFEPFMRPLFRVPGSGGFVMAVALISGNPMGAKLTTRLREQNLITREEGERLVSFACTAGPLFIFGAIAIGFFENPAAGVLIAVVHYVSCFIVAFFMRLHARDKELTPSPKHGGKRFIRAFQAMHRARITDDRPIGQLLGEAVSSAVQTLLMIGGFVIIFSVLIHVFTYVGITAWIASLILPILHLLHLSDLLSIPIVAGILEMTIGSQMISENTVNTSLLMQLAFVGFFLGWNGLSIHAQVASVLSKSDIRYRPYFVGRILHGILAFLLTFVFWKPFQPDVQTTAPASLHIWSTHVPSPVFNWWVCLQGFSLLMLCFWFFFLMKQLLNRKSFTS